MGYIRKMAQYTVEFLDEVDPQALQQYWTNCLSLEPTSHVTYEPQVMVLTTKPKLAQEYMPENHVKLNKRGCSCVHGQLFDINSILPMLHQFSRVAFEESSEKQKDYRRQVILVMINGINLERQLKGNFLQDLAESELGYELILTDETCPSETNTDTGMESSSFVDFVPMLSQLEKTLPPAIFRELIVSIIVFVYNTQRVAPAQKGRELQQCAEHYYGHRLEKKASWMKKCLVL